MIPGSKPSRLLLLYFLLITLPGAEAKEAARTLVLEESGRRNNLILTGTLPGATALRVWAEGPGIEKPVALVIPLRSGELLEGIAVPAGQERVLEVTAFAADEQPLFTGRIGLTVGEEITNPLELELTSKLDGTTALLTIASHRLEVEAFGTGEMEAPTTRLQARFYDADGALQPLIADDVEWDIDDRSLHRACIARSISGFPRRARSPTTTSLTAGVRTVSASSAMVPRRFRRSSPYASRSIDLRK
jgi:hypothetical protein